MTSANDVRGELAGAVLRGSIHGDHVREPLPTTQEAALYAERVVLATFGASELRRQLPFSVSDDGPIWTIQGASAPDILTGPIVLELTKSDARVLQMYRRGPVAPTWPAASGGSR